MQIDNEDRELLGLDPYEPLTYADCLEAIELAHNMAVNNYDFDPYFDENSRCPNCGVPGEEFESGWVCEDCEIEWYKPDVD